MYNRMDKMDEDLKIVDIKTITRTIESNIVTIERMQEIQKISENLGYKLINSTICNLKLIMKFTKVID